ncbi:MAG TPA: pilus assembly protein TadG-related protein [Thermoanaerobaculia bacterium]|nr:pilus assembly protein TadG-related protein [Thermoanaerobaculia bacterium]
MTRRVPGATDVEMTEDLHNGLPKPTRVHRESEKGQVLVLFVLIMLTCTAIATVAISVGQVAVRRQQAQMIVDAAAFAGAAKQAEGMNNIAQLNQMSLDLLKVIYFTTFIPYIDKDSTTDIRALIGPVSALTNDWAEPVLKDYQKIFDTIDGAINVTNRIYSNSGLPRIAAEQVINANFGNANDRIFKTADKGSSGYPNPLDLGKNGFRLVNLTERDTYRGHTYTYFYNPAGNSVAVTTCRSLPNAPLPLGVACFAILTAQYVLTNAAIAVKREIDPIEYQTGRFYNQSQGDDVRFTYMLTVTQAPVMFGRSWFNDIPEITVVASAKPYNGYLGEKFNGGGFLGLVPFSQNKEIKVTYQAKLVPVRNADKIFAARFNPNKAARILH